MATHKKRPTGLTALFGAAAIGAALMFSSVQANAHTLVPDTNPQTSETTISVKPTQAATTAGATIIDLKENPYDLSPAVNHIVTSTKEALAADKKVIIMLGEDHSTTTNVHMAERIRAALQKTGIKRPVMAKEMPNNFLEFLLPQIVPELDNEDFYERATKALTTLKKEDPAQYRRLQSLSAAAFEFPEAPVTNLENLTTWIKNELDIRFIDIARGENDYSVAYHGNPETRNFIDKQQLPAIQQKEYIYLRGYTGVKLRNLWMIKAINEILADESNRVVILQTGAIHLGGYHPKGFSYPNSLHGMFSKKARDDIKVITLFPENFGDTFENSFSAAAQESMNNKNTIILRNADETQHVKTPDASSLTEEIKSLKKISGKMKHVKTKEHYSSIRKEFKSALVHELLSITAKYTPLKQENPKPRTAPMPN